MVGLAGYDAVAAIDLLQQDDSHQLMREGHLRVGEFHGRLFLDGGGQSVGTPDDESERAAGFS